MPQARGAPNAKPYVTEPTSPLFPFGFGLGYSVPTIKSASVQAGPGPLGADSIVNVTGTLANAGPAGAIVLQVYFSQASGSTEGVGGWRRPRVGPTCCALQNPRTKYVRYANQLVAFAKVRQGCCVALPSLSLAPDLGAGRCPSAPTPTRCPSPSPCACATWRRGTPRLVREGDQVGSIELTRLTGRGSVTCPLCPGVQARTSYTRARTRSRLASARPICRSRGLSRPSSPTTGHAQASLAPLPPRVRRGKPYPHGLAGCSTMHFKTAGQQRASFNVCEPTSTFCVPAWLGLDMLVTT